MNNEIHFVRDDVPEATVDLLLGPFEPTDGPIIKLDSTFTNLAQIMWKAGVFPSVTQAKKNGWDKPINSGFSHFVVGKSKKNIFVVWP